MLGLFAFFYACLHLATYVGVDQFFDWRAIVADVVKRKFITVGLLAFALLVPLALTSTDRCGAAARLRALEAPPPARLRSRPSAASCTSSGA